MIRALYPSSLGLKLLSVSLVALLMGAPALVEAAETVAALPGFIETGKESGPASLPIEMADEAPSTPQPAPAQPAGQQPAEQQQPATVAPTAAPSPAPANQGAVSTTSFTREELKKLLAPIALYPDPLLAQMLPASAYPLQIVQVHRLLEKNAVAISKNDYSSIDSMKWDAAVTSIARHPGAPGGSAKGRRAEEHAAADGVDERRIDRRRQLHHDPTDESLRHVRADL
jgi:hypothetical protein